MRRLFWVGVGAVGAVVLAERVRRAAHRYTPAGVGEQVDAASKATTSALRAAVDQLKTSMAAREKDLVSALLVTPQAGDADAVFGRRRTDRRSSPDADAGLWAQNATRSYPGPRSEASRPAGRVDDDEPLYDF